MLQVVRYNLFSVKSKLILIAIFAILALGHEANATTLYLSPANAKVSAGNILSVKVMLNSDGQNINNSSAIIEYPTELLQTISVSKGSSIFSLWVEDPKFSNYEGTITFDGGIPNPGYSGQGGEVISITFRAKKEGTANVILSEGSIKKNDGLGTEALTAKLPAIINISPATQTDVPINTNLADSLPAKPLITSNTHPDQNKWYKAKSATFNWAVPSEVTSIQTLLSKNQTTPTVTYDSSVTQRTVSNLSDGILYFNIRYMNNIGWGPVNNYRIQVDQTSPEKFLPSIKTQDSRNVITLNAQDKTSGIDYYSIKIGDNESFKLKSHEIIDGEYTLPVQNPGDYNVVVNAYDYAGNNTQASLVMNSFEIEVPKITLDPNKIQRGDSVNVLGRSVYKNSPVEVSITYTNKNTIKYKAVTDNEGVFNVTTDQLKTSGTAYVTAQMVFSESVKSKQSERLALLISDTPIVATSKSILYSMAFIIPIILLILGLVFALYIAWHKFFSLKRKLQREVRDTADNVHNAIHLFKEELSKQLAKLEAVKVDRDLNKKEEKIFKELQTNIEAIDDFIEKKLKKLKL